MAWSTLAALAATLLGTRLDANYLWEIGDAYRWETATDAQVAAYPG